MTLSINNVSNSVYGTIRTKFNENLDNLMERNRSVEEIHIKLISWKNKNSYSLETSQSYLSTLIQSLLIFYLKKQPPIDDSSCFVDDSLFDWHNRVLWLYCWTEQNEVCWNGKNVLFWKGIFKSHPFVIPNRIN